MPKVVCVILCVYGIEIAQFNVVTTSLSQNYGVNIYLVIAVLLALVLYAGIGGVDRVGQVCSMIIPVFTVSYVGMGLWVLINNAAAIPEALTTVFTSAFTGHAAVGGFAGSGLILAMGQGIRFGCYTGDIGVGYASVIHSETQQESPSKQAALTIMEIFLDTFVIVTTTILLILVTGIWKEPIHESLLVQTVLNQYFPFAKYFVPLFLLLLGYSTIIAYFVFGLKASEFLSPQYGKKVYFVVAAVGLTVFSFLETRQALDVMSISGGLLLLFNIYGMWRLRKEIVFNVDE